MAPAGAGAVEPAFFKVPSADEGEDAAVFVADGDEGTLEVGDGAGLFFAEVLEIAGAGGVVVVGIVLDVLELAFEFGFGGALEGEVDGGFDVEAATGEGAGGEVEELFRLFLCGLRGVGAGGLPQGADGEGLGEGGLHLCFGDVVVFAHPGEGAGFGFLRFFRAVPGGEGVRPGDDSGEHGGFGEGEVFGFFAEVGLGGGADAVDVAAEEDAVEVEGEDARV